MWPFALLIGLPLIEISLFVTIGAAIGLGATLLIILGTAAGGMALIRAQGGPSSMRDFQRNADPLSPLAHKAMLVAAGIMLILPGFLTDTLGLLLMLPPVRGLVMRRIAAKVRVVRPQPPRDATIDGEFIDLDAEKATHRPPSAWTRH
ncbi:FxsA family protein [Falsirhodobacter algicola]|uniref:FxsA family protein n=1 Tax=Falsirhodobacter algicola TaxID=2692330 RepID=A0A8J8MU03_9RHOB|nr:FxsA family protein [Falsirhodobacter algicola]QUS36427.1 FxsA family protein [Falsirhodobacter algicola]